MKKFKVLKEFGAHKTGAVIELDEAQAKVLLAQKMVEEVVDASDKDAVAKIVAEALLGLKAGIGDTIAAAFKDATSSITHNKLGKSFSISVGKDRREDDSTGGFANMGEFAKAVKVHNGNGATDERLKVLIAVDTKAAQGANEAVGEEGGILIPEQFAAGIWERAQASSDLISRVQTVPVTGNTYTILQEMGDTRAAGVRNAGIRAYWVEEAGQMPKSQPKFKRMTMRLKKMAILAYVTDEQLEDSPMSLDAWLTNKAGLEFAFQLGDALINGNGVGMPLGIVNAPCLITITKEAGQAADTVVVQNILKMYSRMYAPSRGSAIWNINQDAELQLLTLTLPAGTAAIPLMLLPGGFNNAPQQTMLAKPVMPTEWNATLGDANDLILADWSQYMMITKGGIKSAVSMHLRFDYNETAFRFTYRCDGMPAWSAPYTPYKGVSNTQSCFVALGARA